MKSHWHPYLVAVCVAGLALAVASSRPLAGREEKSAGLSEDSGLANGFPDTARAGVRNAEPARVIASDGAAAEARGPGESRGPRNQTRGRYRVVETQNPIYRPNRLFPDQEDLTSPRFCELRSRFKLDAVVQGEGDEFRRILLLRQWVNRWIVVDRNKPAVEGDAIRILEEAPKGGRYHCEHCRIAQNAVMNAMGYVARLVFAGAGEKEMPLSGAHGVNEIWSNTYRKWILMDAELDSHFEKNGMPLSGLEIRDEVLRDGAKQVIRVRGVERQPVLRERDDTWGHTPRTYAWISWYPESNSHTIWPRRFSGTEIVLDDEHFRANTWYRAGRKHWAYDAGRFHRVQDRALIEWTPNVLDVKTRIAGDSAAVEIVSSTPNLKEYQMKETGGEWKPVGETLTLPLRREREERRFRSVNLAGVTGPEYRLVISRQ